MLGRILLRWIDSTMLCVQQIRHVSSLTLSICSWDSQAPQSINVRVFVTKEFQAPWSGLSMEDVLFAIVNFTAQISLNSPRSSPRAAQTTYPSGQPRYIVHSVRNSCVRCWQVNECCVTWFCFIARRVTTVFLHSTLNTSLSSHWSA